MCQQHFFFNQKNILKTFYDTLMNFFFFSATIVAENVKKEKKSYIDIMVNSK